jgi:GMP synthase-like glutamine amidotransferase
MKILLINNYQQGNETATYEALLASLAGYEVETQRYQPGIKFRDESKDLVILSGGGGEGSEIHDEYQKDKLWYQDQINYVLASTKPILGVCMGFEVIARAYGSQVLEMKDYITGFKKLRTTNRGKNALQKTSLLQYENHTWSVPSVSTKEFAILAESPTGVEMISHKTRKILATQFHPEEGGTIDLGHLVKNLDYISGSIA